MAYRAFEEVLADPEVTVLHLCTPNYLHYEMAKAAFKAGKHVLCEKPVASTRSEAAEMVKLEKDAQRVGAVNYNLRFYPLNQEARARIAAGDLGEIRIIHGEYCQDWLFLPSDWNWRLQPDLGGNLRVVADIGTHWMDAVTWLTGLEIRSVCADFATFLPTRYKPQSEVETFAGKLSAKIEGEAVEIHTEDYAAILFKFSNRRPGNADPFANQRRAQEQLLVGAERKQVLPELAPGEPQRTLDRSPRKTERIPAQRPFAYATGGACHGRLSRRARRRLPGHVCPAIQILLCLHRRRRFRQAAPLRHF